MELDIAAINVQVDKAGAPQSVKGKGSDPRTAVPGLNLGAALLKAKTGVETPSSRRQQIHLETLQESDYDEDDMNIGHMATTQNQSHDSDDLREAEEKFRRMMSGVETGRDSVASKVEDVASADDSEVTPQVAGSAKKGKDAEGSVFEVVKQEQSESSPEKEEAKGENLVVDDQHRNTAIELFENYFARAYRRKDNAPMTKKRFIKRIENAKRREMFDDDYVKKFEQLFTDAKKDD